MYTYIVGAGNSGKIILDLLRKKTFKRTFLAFLDDDPQKHSIDGIPVKPIHEFLAQHKANFSELIIAIPSIKRERLREIYYAAKAAGFMRIRILSPSDYIAANKTVSLSQLRNIQPEDIIPMKSVPINISDNLQMFKGQRVLITGAGGTVGSESAKQLLYSSADALFLLGHGEQSLHLLEQELDILSDDGIGSTIHRQSFLGDVKNADHMLYLMEEIRPDIILHTAAYKHAPLLEHNAIAAIENNIFGTSILLHAAELAGCKKFVCMSTDKAVHPSNVYGASKLFAERLVLNFEPGKMLRFAIRCGNILASRGSVIHNFRNRIEREAPLQITSPKSKRFFMSISEATSMLLNIAAAGKNRSLYILHMENELAIADIASELILFYGYDTDSYDIRYTGLRPGEKESEHIRYDNEEETESGLPAITELQDATNNSNNLAQQLELLRPFCYKDSSKAHLYRNVSTLKEYLRSINLLRV